MMSGRRLAVLFAGVVAVALTLSGCVGGGTVGHATGGGLDVSVMSAGERPAVDRGSGAQVVEGDPICLLHVTAKNNTSGDVSVQNALITSSAGGAIEVDLGGYKPTDGDWPSFYDLTHETRSIEAGAEVSFQTAYICNVPDDAAITLAIYPPAAESDEAIVEVPLSR